MLTTIIICFIAFGIGYAVAPWFIGVMFRFWLRYKFYKARREIEAADRAAAIAEKWRRHYGVRK